eukprot:1604752-Prymnesium_polylepis.1
MNGRPLTRKDRARMARAAQQDETHATLYLDLFRGFRADACNTRYGKRERKITGLADAHLGFRDCGVVISIFGDCGKNAKRNASGRISTIQRRVHPPHALRPERPKLKPPVEAEQALVVTRVVPHAQAALELRVRKDATARAALAAVAALVEADGVRRERP